MRLWSVHPQYLDRAGLLACWREGLLAQEALLSILENRTYGYQNHSQLRRFKEHREGSMKLIGWYLWFIHLEGQMRLTRKGQPYNFDISLIKVLHGYNYQPPMYLSVGQLRYEVKLLKSKLNPDSRGNQRVEFTRDVPVPHPIFKLNLSDNQIADWERVPGRKRHVTQFSKLT